MKEQWNGVQQGHGMSLGVATIGLCNTDHCTSRLNRPLAPLPRVGSHGQGRRLW